MRESRLYLGSLFTELWRKSWTRLISFLPSLSNILVSLQLRPSLLKRTLTVRLCGAEVCLLLRALPWTGFSIILSKENKLWRSPCNYLPSFYIVFPATAITLALRFLTPPSLCSFHLSRDRVSQPYKTKWDCWRIIKLLACKLQHVLKLQLLQSSLLFFFMTLCTSANDVTRHDSCGLSWATCGFEWHGRKFGSCLRIRRVRPSSWGTIWAEYPSGCWVTSFDCTLQKDVSTVVMTPRPGDSFQLEGKRVVV